MRVACLCALLVASALAAQPVLNFESADGTACTITKAGGKLKSSCDLSSTNLETLAAKVDSIDTRLLKVEKQLKLINKRCEALTIKASEIAAENATVRHLLSRSQLLPERVDRRLLVIVLPLQPALRMKAM